MKGTFPRIMLVLVFLALVANVVVTAVMGQSFITRQMLFRLLFGGLIVANLCISGAAIYFTSKALAKNERSSLKWSRRGFVANVGIALLFGAGPWVFPFHPDALLFEAMRDYAFFLLLLGVSNGVFAIAAYRDFVRAVGPHGPSSEFRRRRKVPHRSGPHPPGTSWED
jgi:hypothetical protein